MNTMELIYEDIKQKAKEAKELAARKTGEALEYLAENKEVAAVVIPAAIYGGTRIITNAQTRSRMREKNREIERRIYDPQEGHYWYTNRKLNNRDFEDISRLRRAGFSREQALRYLGLLR